jgi:hypothetical protein
VTEENHEKLVRICDVPAEIRTEGLQKKNPERY